MARDDKEGSPPTSTKPKASVTAVKRKLDDCVHSSCTVKRSLPTDCHGARCSHASLQSGKSDEEILSNT